MTQRRGRRKKRLSPERRGFIEAAMEFAADFPDGAFLGYMQECGISTEELIACSDKEPSP